MLGVWAIASGEGKELITFKNGEVWDFDLSPDGKELGVAVVEEARSLLVKVDIATGEITGAVVLKEVILGSVRYHPSGAVLATDNTDTNSTTRSALL